MSVAAHSLIAPAFQSVPEQVGSAGAEVADLAAACGFVPDPEQRLYLDGTYAEEVPGSDFRSGRWAAFESAIICPRQNAKTAALEMSVLGDLFLLRADLVVWTAHRFQTAIEAFLDFKNLIDGNAMLSRRVKRITEASGNEGIELMSGQRLKFLARSKSSGRGLTGDVVILDEAFALTTAEMGALLPTLSARPNAQVRYGSSAGLVDSAVLRTIRDRGRAGGDRSLFYAEWCVTKRCENDQCDHALDAAGCVLDDMDALGQANFAMGRRIPRESIASERRALSPEEFGRERAGWWDEPKGGNVIPMTRWAPLGTSPGMIDGPIAVFVDVTLDRKQSGIGVCGLNADGVPQVELAAVEPGTDWVTDKLDAMIAAHDVVAVGATSAGPVASLLPDLKGICEAAGVTFVKAGSGDFAGMCGGFYDAVMAASLRHWSDPRIDMALAAAKRHKVVDAWSWERERVDVDSMPLRLVTGAHALFLRHGMTAEDPYDPIQNIW
ncbi:hypothetical protein K0U83_20085 [bacterium]|nr:hypothetical protein [bacterium]